MYFKIKNKILYRQYDAYGYISDNAMFGYRMLDDGSFYPGEEYVSESGAVMLGMLSKSPRSLDSVVEELFDFFQEVDFEELKKDTFDFFMQFIEAGFLCCGDSVDECNANDNELIISDESEQFEDSFLKEDCGKNIINPKDFLRSVHIEIANECNERCVHCYIPHEYKKNVIDSDLFYKIVEEARSLNVLNVTLSGGEPLLHKDFVRFLRRCKELDLSVNILTNLTLLTDEIIEEMRKNPLLSVQTSLYSMQPELHDAITMREGSFEKTKDNILKLCSSRIPVQISCPVMKQNKESYKTVVEWGRAHNIQVGTDFVIFAEYDDSNKNLESRLSFEEVEKIYDDELTDENVDYILEKVHEKRELTGDSPVCSVCRYYLCVSAEGDVFPCVGWKTKIIGNLYKQTIAEIWDDSEKVKKLRNTKLERFEKCLDCDDRGFCTICMMNNSNENLDGDEFRVTDFHCKVAAMIHSKVDLIRGL